MKQCWITKENENKRIFLSDLEGYILLGYRKGRKCSWVKTDQLIPFRKGIDERRSNSNGPSIEARKLGALSYKNNCEKRYSECSFDQLNSRYLKTRRVLEEQENKCFFCSISEWQGQKIVLELDHIDGNKENESRNNLRCLCPNCHSQTPTWRRKKSSKNLTLIR